MVSHLCTLTTSYHLYFSIYVFVCLGREPIMILTENTLDDARIPLDDFEYNTTNVDSDFVTATPQDLSSQLYCCDCDGPCDDIETCGCLAAQQQKNYSSQGLLLPHAVRPILECNLSCGCSMRVCTNRVVERGTLSPFKRPFLSTLVLNPL